jgi:predicted NBD/HSP70 family sugar kinase
MQTANRVLVRAINRSAILNTIRERETIDRAEAARLTGLSPATVTSITSGLIEDGLVYEKTVGDSRGGRPPILLELNPRGGFAIGIKVTEHEAIAALTNLKAAVITKRNLAIQNHNPENVIGILVRLVDDLIETADIPEKRLLGIGIGLAGIVDFDKGMLRQSPFFGWSDLPLGQLLSEKLHVPVYIDNDVNTLALAEKWFGAGKGFDHFLTITIGRGVGLGIVVNGQFYRGQGGGAGEFGHIVVDPNGPDCACGKKGCLELFVGDPGLLRMAEQAFDQGKIPAKVNTVDKLHQLADDGNEIAQKIFAKAGSIFGLAIANLINVMNPQRVIIGGEGVYAGEWLFNPMHSVIEANVMPTLSGDTEVKIEPWGDDAWARGAASLVLDEFFNSPVHRKKKEKAAQ